MGVLRISRIAVYGLGCTVQGFFELFGLLFFVAGSELHGG